MAKREREYEGPGARDEIMTDMLLMKIPRLQAGVILDEAAAKGAFTSGAFKVTVTFRKGKWRLVTGE